MRIVCWGFILVSAFMIGNSVYAGTGEGFRLEKAILNSEWSEADGFESYLGSGVQGKWDWLTIDIDDKFYLRPVAGLYSSLNTQFTLRHFCEDLKYNIKYQWNEDYNKFITGANYVWEPWHDFKLDFGLEDGWRHGTNADKEKFRYTVNSQEIGLKYDLDSYGYRCDVNRINKNYPNAIYSSTKIDLNQKIIWRFKPNSSIELGYQEKTGEYPDILSYNHWKEIWSLGAAGDFMGKWHWDSEISMMEWNQNYCYPYRTAQKIQIKFISPPADWRLWINARYADLYYDTSTVYDDPDEEDEDDELKNRIEQKLSIEIRRFLTKNYIGFGCFIANYNYTSTKINDFGYYGLVDWEFGKISLLIKLAPLGDLSTRGGYYQVKVEYQP